MAEKTAKQLISGLTDDELMTQWEMTGAIASKHIPTVRGWLMDEIESRYPEAFNRWLDGDADDNELREYINGAR